METQKISRSGVTLSLLFLFSFPAPPAAAQLAPASAAVLGSGNNYTALVRGFASVGSNPAGLGMPDSPGFSLALLPVSGAQTLSPVSLSDLAGVGGTLISASTRADWMSRISEAGAQTGGGAIDLTFLAFNAGPVGVQASTLARSNARLNEDASELLLFGNAGRNGTAADFDLSGSRADAVVVSTLGVGFGMPVFLSDGFWADATLAVGATLKYSVGNALVLAEDVGSQLLSDPLEVSIGFPMIQSDTADLDPSHGSGIGLDLGLALERGAWKAAAVLQNVFHTFAWDLEGMFYRSGEAVFDEEVSESSFDLEPIGQAPQELRNAAEGLVFKPQLSLGAAYSVAPDLTVTGDLRKRFGGGIEVGPDFHLGLGVEFRKLGFLPLRAGVAKITDGILVGGGVSLIAGPASLTWGGALQRGDVDGALVSITLSFSGL